ncbi:MAG: sigma-70 family RNA polymerase sigma factor [Saprospiraceae bacterium]|nr:sigma-70 family RNA polymerase sigma factor [Saprospiraceae bacterium]
MELKPLYRQSKEQLTDKIISECLSGSNHAQRQLFEMYYSEGMNVALRYSSRSEDAKEILANAFIRVFEKLEQFDLSKSFSPWFRKFIIHASSDYYRYQKSIILPLEQITEVRIDDQIIDQMAYQDLLNLIQELPYSLRTVFNLYCIEGYKHQEIAEIMHISEGTSKSNLHRAKARLQVMIIEFSKQRAIGSIRQEDKTKVNERT